MTFDESRLLAYVDRQLSKQEMAEVDALLERDEEARAFVESLRRTPPGLKDALDSALDRPLPPELTHTLLNAPVARPNSERYGVGAILAGVIFALVAGALGGWWFGMNNNTATAADSWITAVADYQVLYGRQTLSQADASSRQIAETQTRLSKAFQHPVSIPNLRRLGLNFKRGQILEFENRPIVQLAYLPTQGKPVAYCLTENPGPDRGPSVQTIKDLKLVHWRSGNIGHVLVGEANNASLESVAAFIMLSMD